ncbi:WXG100 family type VII secretion target [Nocardia puris]|nr:WXG100 family type VII secretion target [Nocardia puris]
MGSGSDSDDQLNVVPAEVSDSGQFVKLTAEELIAEVRSVDREIEQLMSSWTGDAANAYLQGRMVTNSVRIVNTRSRELEFLSGSVR